MTLVRLVSVKWCGGSLTAVDWGEYRKRRHWDVGMIIILRALAAMMGFLLLLFSLKKKSTTTKNPEEENCESGTKSAPCYLVSTVSLKLRIHCSFRRMSQLDSTTMGITILFCQEQLT